MTKTKNILFITITCMFWFSLYSYVPTFPTYLDKIGIPLSFIGIILGSYGFSQMLVRIPLGILSDKTNMKKPYVLMGIFIVSIGGLLMYFSNNGIMMLVSRTLTGIGVSSWVIFTVLYSSYFTDDNKSIGVMTACVFLGQLIAMFTGGLASDYISPKSPFLFAFFIGIFALILGIFFIDEKKVDKKPITKDDIILVSKNSTLILVSIIAIFFQLIAFATVFGFNPIIAKDLGASDFILGILAAFSTIPSMFASFLSGTIFTRKYGIRKTIISGFLITAIIVLITPFSKSLTFLILIQMIGGFSKGIIFPPLMALSIKNVSPSLKATSMGFFQAIYGLGMFMGPFITGLLTENFNLNIAYITIGGLSLVAMLISFKIGKEKNYG